MTAEPANIPIGQVEFMGRVVHIVEHNGHLVAACHDEHGMPFEAIASPRLDGQGCRDLMREVVDLLIEAADISLILSALATSRRSHFGRRGRDRATRTARRGRSQRDESPIRLTARRPPA